MICCLNRSGNSMVKILLSLFIAFQVMAHGQEVFTSGSKGLQVADNSRVLPPGEFRAAWVATVNNMDWPSQPGLSAAVQQREAIRLLDLAVQLKLNAIIFQVRPHCDAFYNSPFEPWSYYLQGRQGVGPGYDPLQFWIQEAHKRGLELHAWFNPYRMRHPKMKGDYAAKSIAKRRPQWGYALKNGYAWLDPGLKDVQDYSIKIIMDVVNRYDIDGVHLDDYFYPYKDYMHKGVFPDAQTYGAYRRAGGNLVLADWRRDNINRFVQKLSNSIKASGKLIRFGISPFGIWKPNHPVGIKGMNPYEQLFADSRKWMQEGWVDYIAPQLYWSTESKDHNFTRILDWWRSQNIKNVNIYPGLAIYKVPQFREGANQILRQIQVINQRQDVRGYIHFNLKPILDNRQTSSTLIRGVPTGALTPPLKPKGFKGYAENIRLNGNVLSWQCRTPSVRRWLVYVGKTPIVYAGTTRSVNLSGLPAADRISILPIGPAGVPGIMISITGR